MSISKKSLKICVMIFFFVGCFAYICFLVTKIRGISKRNYSDEVPCKNHIIVGALDSEQEALLSFYGGVKSVTDENNSALELLKPNSLSLEEITDYTEFVSADGLILFSLGKNISVKKLEDYHENNIPYVLFGNVNNPIFPDYKNYVEELKAIALQSDVKKICPIVTEKNAGVVYQTVYPKMEKELKDRFVISNLNFSDKEFIEEELYNAFIKLRQSSEPVLIVCFSSQVANLACRTAVELNMVNLVKIVTFMGNSETESFAQKGIVQAVLMPDFYEYGKKCALKILEKINDGGEQ